MWFRRKKKSEPVRKKRKPKEWAIPKDKAAEIIDLYDDMMQAAMLGLVTNGYARKLPRFLFWQKVLEVIPETRKYPVQVESTNNCFCIKIVETVADDDYEPEQPTIAQTSAETEAVLRELEDKLNQESPSPSPFPTIEESLAEIEAKPDLGATNG
jgi:uncharacterized protein YfcZ (UPF0381/DUF406 family)